VPQDMRLALDAPDWISMALMPIAQAQASDIARTDANARRLEADMQPMGAKRRGEFLAGRVCAARALEAAGAGRIGYVPRGEDKLPVWPAGWHGSISHSTAWAAAAVAASRHCVALGFDIQERVSPRVMTEVLPLIANTAELARASPYFERRSALTLLFSAKESLYKALHPLVRTFQDFDGAELTSITPTRLQLTLTRSWGPGGWEAGTAVWMHYTWQDDLVATLCWLSGNRGA